MFKESVGWIVALTFFLLAIFGLTDIEGTLHVPKFVWSDCLALGIVTAGVTFVTQWDSENNSGEA